MTKQPRSDAHLVFQELRQLCRSSTGDASRLAIGVLVAALRDAAAADGPDSEQLLKSASMLWGNISQRIGSALTEFDRQVDARLSAQPRPADDADWLERDLTRAIREIRPHTYARYLHGVVSVSAAPWQAQQLNPLSARVFCRAFLASVRDVTDLAPVRALIDDSLLTELGGALSAVYVTGESFLDVTVRLPDVNARVPDPNPDTAPATDVGGQTGIGNLDSVPDVSSSATDNQSRDLSPETAQNTAVPPDTAAAADAPSVQFGLHAWYADQASRQLGFSRSGGGVRGATLTQVRGLKPVADMERDAVAYAHAQGVRPFSGESRRRYFSDVHAQLAAGGSSPAQLAMIDLVAAMFDFVVDERRLPDAARPLCWRLQQPVLLLSLMDTAYLSDDKRSVRELVGHFGAISTAFGDELTRGGELYQRLETVVRALEVISNVLFLRTQVLSEQVHKEYERCAVGVTRLVDRIRRERLTLESTPARRNRRDYARRPGREEERQVTDQLAAELTSKLSQHTVPDSVRHFLESVWLRHMRTVRLRSGERSDEYRAAVSVVDDLVWTLNGQGRKQSRSELAQRIPGLIDELMRGMRLIGAREEDHQAFFDELFLLHLRKLRRRHGTSDGAPATSAEPVELAGTTAGLPVLDNPVTGTTAAALPVSDTVDTATVDNNESVPVLTLSDELTQDPDTLGAETGALQAPVSAGPAATADPTGHEITRDAGRTASRNASTEPLTPLIELPVHDAGSVSTMAPESLLPQTATLVATTAAGATAGAWQPDSTRTSNSPAHGGWSHEPVTLDNALVNLLSAATLADLPDQPRYVEGSVEQVFSHLRPGHWVELQGENQRLLWLKVAWMNPRRSTLLLVRYPDRRAISRSGVEVKQLLARGRLKVLADA